jgi:hypothetical protein
MESEPIFGERQHTRSVSNPTDTVQGTSVNKRTLPWPTILPYLLGLLFFLLALRGSFGTDILDPDAARHAMNGVFLHDFLLSGQTRHPVAYAKEYYAHFPAISLPYHPPLFPLVESMFFLICGVHYFIARLVIALFTAGCVILLYKLVLKTGGTHLLTAASAITFLGLLGSFLVSSDIMLEFPALFFTIGALYILGGPAPFGNWRSSFGFAVLAAAAVWTKQQTIFLGIVPFIQIAITGEWRLLKNRWLWFSLAVFSVLVGVLAMVSIGSGFSSNPGWRHGGVVSMAAQRLHLYSRGLWVQFTPPAALFIGGAFVFFLLTARRSSALKVGLYLSWVLSFWIELLLLPPYDVRYLFFMQPPLLILGYAALSQLTERFRWKPNAEVVGAAVLIVVVAVNLARPSVFLQGPSQAASFVSSPEYNRVVYCGRTNGAFVFARRLLDPKLQSIVIRGDKLSTDLLQPDRFEHFAHDYGVHYVILEQTGRSTAWDALTASPPPSMQWQRDIPLRCTFADRNGVLRIYRFTDPSANPQRTIHPESGIYKQELDLTR